MRAIRIIVAAALLACCPSVSALAQTGGAEPSEADFARVEQLYLEGVALYKKNNHRAALAKFEEAYAIFPDPNLLYNMGRSHELLGELDEALVDFQKCIASPDVTDDLRGKATTRAEAIKKAQAAAKDADKNVVVAPPGDGDKSDDKGGGAAEGGGATIDDGGGGLAVAKWGTGVAALGLLGTGAAFFALGASDHSELDDAIASDGVAPLTRLEAEELAKSGEDNKTLGVALMGAGAGLGLLSVVFFIMDSGDDDGSDDASALGVQPTPFGAGATVTFGGRF